ncbi:MAG: hypothetical protein DI565_19560 [Ancylobacter novellus]|uniref:Uncharacterized protein n=1 Tax=Ancylobacter novellus TaxID=921 RepID=A0A2W5LU12_ANCNO|nr:MAG: hypothetical protein DI565_19560 [Ancylobacter novellus]
MIGVECDGKVLQAGSDALARWLNKLWGVTELSLEDVDLICLVGMGASVRLSGSIYGGYRSLRMSMEGAKHLVSEPTLRLAMSGLIEQSLFAHVARTVRQASEAPILCLPQPMPSQTFESMGLPDWIAMALRNGDAEALVFLADELLLDALPVSAIVRQPAETLANAMVTRNEFMTGAEALGEFEEGRDLTHANSRYGAVVMALVERDYA